MTARDIANALSHYYKWHPRTHILIPNLITHMGHECDLVCVHPSGYADEIEIKVNLTDFKREFADKERKHRILVNGIPSYLVGGGDDWTRCRPHRVRRFWFAVPASLEPSVKGLVPDYAGLFVVEDLGARGYRVRVAKLAENLRNSQKFGAAERNDLYRLGYLRYWTERMRSAS